ncbi:MAG: class II aldolase/adducin family protein [Spirochaetaceae bacterium]|nr:class II aldolase/adducin family protein [Myxococcales bacterium]MCB9725244.1 class II aldolase/adducin family protein [Spirochaetaceae bacterium]HPG24111.1 class II aldolase/adducin family protein [Myxococcota bacterium]
MQDTHESAQEIVRVARHLEEQGLNLAASGNVSIRLDEGMLITPSGVEPTRLAPERLVRVALDGRVLSAGKPSSEWAMHAALYRRRSDVGAVVHCHSRFATVLACAHHEIPALHYMVVATGASRIPLAPYATFGTEALSDAVVGTLGAGDACLLANHGQIAVGRDLAAALATAELVERLAETHWGALAIGGPRLLEEAEMRRVADRFAAGYGRADDPA